jgi:hypothetical protein
MLKRSLTSLGQMMYQQTRDIRVMNYEKHIVYDIPRNGESLKIIQNKLTGEIECPPVHLAESVEKISLCHSLRQLKK